MSRSRELKPLTELKPERAGNLGERWVEAQLAAGRGAGLQRGAETAKTDRLPIRGRSRSSYTDSAATNYQKAIDLSDRAGRQSRIPDNLSAYYLNLGQAYSEDRQDHRSRPRRMTISRRRPQPAKAGTAGAYYNGPVVFYTNEQECRKQRCSGGQGDCRRSRSARMRTTSRRQALIPGASRWIRRPEQVHRAACRAAWKRISSIWSSPRMAPHATEVKENPEVDIEASR